MGGVRGDKAPNDKGEGRGQATRGGLVRHKKWLEK